MTDLTSAVKEALAGFTDAVIQAQVRLQGAVSASQYQDAVRIAGKALCGPPPLGQVSGCPD